MVPCCACRGFGSAGKRLGSGLQASFTTSDQSTARVHRYMTARLSTQVWSSNGAVQLCLPQLRGDRQEAPVKDALLWTQVQSYAYGCYHTIKGPKNLFPQTSSQMWGRVTIQHPPFLFFFLLCFVFNCLKSKVQILLGIILAGPVRGPARLLSSINCTYLRVHPNITKIPGFSTM